MTWAVQAGEPRHDGLLLGPCPVHLALGMECDGQVLTAGKSRRMVQAEDPAEARQNLGLLGGGLVYPAQREHHGGEIAATGKR
jgi:hypothetical protein